MSPNRSVSWRCAQAALLLFAGATLRAQNIVSVSDSPPPQAAFSHSSSVLGLIQHPSAAGWVSLVMSDDRWGANDYSGSQLVFVKEFILSDFIEGIASDSVVASVPNYLICTGFFAFSPSVYMLRSTVPYPITVVAIDDIANPAGIALDSFGAMYLSTSTGVGKYANTSTGTRSLTMGASGSGAGQLSHPGAALAAGGGVIYALDPGNNRIARYDTTTGNYLGSIPLIGTTATTAIVISPNGRLYTANGNGGGTVYDAATGAPLETFSALAANPDSFPGGNASIFLDGRGFIYLYDAATGIHVFSDPGFFSVGADIAIRTDGPAAITAGTNISYNVTVTKKGATDTMGVTLGDVLPAGTTFVSESQTSGPLFTCTNPATGATGSVSCTIASFPAPASATFTIVLKVDSSVADLSTLTNTATASFAIADPIPFDDSASSTANVRASADVAATSSGPATVTSGNDITYIGTVTNNGPSDAHGVVMNDALPRGTTFVSETQNSGPALTCTNPPAGASGVVNCTIPTLASGASAVFTFVVHLGINVTGPPITNKLVVSSSTPDPTPGNNSASSVSTVDPGASTILAVDNFPTPPGSHNFVVGLVASPFPAGRQVSLVTDAEVYGANYYSGSGLAFVKYADVSPVLLLDEAKDVVATSNRLIFAGTFAFQPLVRTYDGVAMLGSVQLDDVAGGKSPGLALDSSGAMYSETITGVARYVNSSTGTRSFTMGASGSGAGQLSIPGGALVVGPDGVLYVLDGGNNRIVRFDSTTGNYLGSIPLSGTTATTALAVTAYGRLYTADGDGGGTIYNAVSGAVLATFKSTVANPDSFIGGGNVTLFLDGRGYIYLYDPATGIHVFSDAASAVTDLSVSASGPVSVTAGSNVSYGVTVTNNGPSDAQGVTLTDALPAGTTFVSEAQGSGPAFTCANPPVGALGSVSCTIATLASGASATFTLVFRVNAGATSGSTVTNVATCSYPGSDPTPGNNSVNAATIVSAGVVDLAITNTPSAPPYGTGLPITYTVVVSNAGPAAASSVVVTDTIPPGTMFNAATPTQGSCSGTSTITCSLGTLTSGTSATVSLVLTLPSTPGPLSSTVMVAASNPDANPANNSSTSSIAVIPASAIPAVSPVALLLLALTMILLGMSRLRT